MRFPKTWFLIKAVLASTLFMFISMAAGELLIDQNLFSGFLSTPSLWLGVFLESALVTLGIGLIGLFILEKLQPKNKKSYLRASLVVWLGLGLSSIVIYKWLYWPRGWQLTSLQPGLIFGWILPCILILISLTLFSGKLYETQNE